MNGFLSRVAAQRRLEVGELRRRLDPAQLRDEASARPPRDFRAALGGGGAIIAEFKRRSPSVPSFRHGVDPTALARTYAAAGAAALSVVTDVEHFGSGPRDAFRAREASGLPVLTKDFVTDPLHVLRLRAAGADAVLLIARMLEGGELRDLIGEVEALGATALVECHDEADLHAARAAGATLVGVNSRDLETLAVDPEAQGRLIGLAAGFALTIAESGIRTRADVERLQALGAGAFLVGGALLAAEDPGALLRNLRGVAA